MSQTLSEFSCPPLRRHLGNPLVLQAKPWYLPISHVNLLDRARKELSCGRPQWASLVPARVPAGDIWPNWVKPCQTPTLAAALPTLPRVGDGGVSLPHPHPICVPSYLQALRPPSQNEGPESLQLR